MKIGASAITGMVWEVINIGYKAFSTNLLICINIAKPMPNIMDTAKPVRVISSVAGRWLNNNSVRSSHSRIPIASGEGKRNIICTILAMTSQITKNNTTRETAGIYFFIGGSSDVNDSLIVFLMREWQADLNPLISAVYPVVPQLLPSV